MANLGQDTAFALPDGRVLEYWDGGDPAGRPMILHPGSPVTRVFGRWGHEAAVSAGVRLMVINRPGYGGSTTNLDASLLATGRDTATLASHLELGGYAVFGSSGGGPFAVATGVADPAHVRALGVVAGVGPWRILDGPSRDPDSDRCVALLDAGDVDGAWDLMRRDVKKWIDELAALEDGPRVDEMLAAHGESSPLFRDPDYRALWADNLRNVIEHPDGHAFDNLAWSRTWDVDPSDVAARTMLWFSEKDDDCPPAHAHWYADRIPNAELVMSADDTHLDVIDGHWPEVLEGLTRLWE